jgi:hypothetical protein
MYLQVTESRLPTLPYLPLMPPTIARYCTLEGKPFGMHSPHSGDPTLRDEIEEDFGRRQARYQKTYIRGYGFGLGRREEFHRWLMLIDRASSAICERSSVV